MDVAAGSTVLYQWSMVAVGLQVFRVSGHDRGRVIPGARAAKTTQPWHPGKAPLGLQYVVGMQHDADSAWLHSMKRYAVGTWLGSQEGILPTWQLLLPIVARSPASCPVWKLEEQFFFFPDIPQKKKSLCNEILPLRAMMC